MPSHIFMRVGRYQDSFDDNIEAAKSDERYIAQCNAQGLYALGYYPHNVHFLAWAAQVEGRKVDALAAARKVAEREPSNEKGMAWGLYDTFLAFPLYTLVRFGMWDEALAEPKPDENNLYLTAIWHYARGLAFANQGDQLEESLSELSSLDALKDQIVKEDAGLKAATLVTIASHLLHGEIAASMGSHTTAVTHFDKAVRLEDSMAYNEPPDWYYSVRHTLGAALLDADRPIEAEVVYWDDLAKHPENANSLFGLAQAMQAQGKDGEADAMQARFETAYARADHTLTSSRY
jgi:tetratricopeptide (TPR) repeat protein